ncbi:MAG TPA: RNA polymerase factor sigma-54 [Microvirga sp.]|jgi:RNA polymerase sigma-54 factor|nr:RNA polymerase factor sigma-54 [Microvirga sp.]
MALMQRLEMRQGQSLVMTPQLLQAIKLLQLSHLDLVAYVEAEFERNPLLERPEAEGPVAEREAPESEPAPETEAWLADDLTPDRAAIEREMDTRLDNVFPDEAPVSARAAGTDADMAPLSPSPWSGGSGGSDEGFEGEAPLTREASLAEHLEAQLDLATRDLVQRLIGRHLINAIDDAGYLTEEVEEVADRLGVETSAVEGVLALVHTFDPPGIGARSLAECLSIQLREKNRFDPAMAALVSRLDLVARRDLPALRRLCGMDDADLAEMLAEIRALEPKPGRAFGAAPVEILVPDVVVRQAPDGSFAVELNPETLPRVLVNQTYYARVAKTAKGEGDKAFLTDCLQSANWLARSLDQRAKTILKVATEIVRQQDGFFRHGVAHLRPLNLKTVADEIGMHESTVSRVTSNKALGTSRGTFEMKYFFTAAIAGAAGAEAHSSEAVRHRIKQLIDAEPADEALSDDALVHKLKAEGIDIARRTVAKYRESLRIPSSVDRRRQKQGLLRAS